MVNVKQMTNVHLFSQNNVKTENILFINKSFVWYLFHFMCATQMQQEKTQKTIKTENCQQKSQNAIIPLQLAHYENSLQMFSKNVGQIIV